MHVTKNHERNPLHEFLGSSKKKDDAVFLRRHCHKMIADVLVFGKWLVQLLAHAETKARYDDIDRFILASSRASSSNERPRQTRFFFLWDVVFLKREN